MTSRDQAEHLALRLIDGKGKCPVAHARKFLRLLDAENNRQPWFKRLYSWLKRT